MPRKKRNQALPEDVLIILSSKIPLTGRLRKEDVKVCTA